MITLDARPRLASKARLRFDKKADRYMLLYPEKGLLLNSTGAKIVKLCTGEHTVSSIVEQMSMEHQGGDPATILTEVTSFLTRLEEAGLLSAEPG